MPNDQLLSNQSIIILKTTTVKEILVSVERLKRANSRYRIVSGGLLLNHIRFLEFWLFAEDFLVFFTYNVTVCDCANGIFVIYDGSYLNSACVRIPPRAVFLSLHFSRCLQLFLLDLWSQFLWKVSPARLLICVRIIYIRSFCYPQASAVLWRLKLNGWEAVHSKF